MKPKINETVYADVSRDIKEQLVAYSKETGISMNFIVQKALEQFFELN